MLHYLDGRSAHLENIRLLQRTSGSFRCISIRQIAIGRIAFQWIETVVIDVAQSEHPQQVASQVAAAKDWTKSLHLPKKAVHAHLRYVASFQLMDVTHRVPRCCQ